MQCADNLSPTLRKVRRHSTKCSNPVNLRGLKSCTKRKLYQWNRRKESLLCLWCLFHCVTEENRPWILMLRASKFAMYYYKNGKTENSTNWVVLSFLIDPHHFCDATQWECSNIVWEIPLQELCSEWTRFTALTDHEFLKWNFFLDATDMLDRLRPYQCKVRFVSSHMYRAKNQAF